jgi:shikimate dehydrogenase
MNKKFLVIGNPIEHSLSPKLHNYWIKKNNLESSYDKKLLAQSEIQRLILDIREEKIHGLNVTVPFKKTIIPFLDILSDEAKNSQSVNTIYKNKDKIVGDNTDIDGFKIGLEKSNYKK